MLDAFLSNCNIILSYSGGKKTLPSDKCECLKVQKYCNKQQCII